MANSIIDADLDKMLQSVEDQISTLSQSLPNMVDVGALGVISKAPYKLLIIRESLIWRTEELARSAIVLWKTDNNVAAALLVRGVMESVALQHKLYSILKGREALTSDSLDDVLMRLLMGYKNDKAFPEAINIKTLVEKLAKKIPSFSEIYDVLSEIAHPNHKGTANLYTRLGHDQFNMLITKNSDRMAFVKTTILSGMNASLGLFIGEYNMIGEEFEIWLTELEKF
ncbi:hypothetical protein [Asticcacaulis machinosus]|uniref:HEPN AbiU2-like domain-containing protein n=1 Tax=Asticcacaulis machinosus TaxID=2984211 RepID=A0ABT5HLN7_9CAUL|nr:hypothetical protein [Asticcacaulis machinosus]MDC7677164.1 hypothetical protein [Asticcacaulis machinosus]